MPLPKVKKNIPLTFPKTLLPRREELLEKINRDGTYLPKSILHADLDGGFLNFVKNELKTVVDGKVDNLLGVLDWDLASATNTDNTFTSLFAFE